MLCCFREFQKVAHPSRRGGVPKDRGSASAEVQQNVPLLRFGQLALRCRTGPERLRDSQQEASAAVWWDDWCSSGSRIIHACTAGTSPVCDARVKVVPAFNQRADESDQAREGTKSPSACEESESGFSSVWEERHLGPNRVVAINVLPRRCRCSRTYPGLSSRLNISVKQGCDWFRQRSLVINISRV